MKQKTEHQKGTVENIYQLNGTVPIVKAIPFGLQHILAMFVANIAPILIVASACGLSDQNTAMLIQSAMLIAGIGTLVQLFPIFHKIGSGLPIVMGISFTFVSILCFVGTQYGYGAIMGAVLIGGIIEGILGLFAKYWLKLIAPIVSASVVTAIGFSLLSVGANSFGGGSGISSFNRVAISGSTVTANGGDSKDGSGGNGIYSSSSVAISGGTVTATGGDSTGSDGSGGNGIYSRNGSIDLSGSLELTAKAGSPNGKALSQNGSELVLDTIKDKLGPGAKVTATDADGKVIDQVSTPRPVEPEESSSSSDGGSAAPSAPVSPLPGLTVTDKDGQRISYTSTQSGNTLTVCVGRFTASFRISLAALRQLRAEGIETITFQTILCSTTLSVDELLAMGGEDAGAVLTHRFTDSSLTVG